MPRKPTFFCYYPTKSKTFQSRENLSTASQVQTTFPNCHKQLKPKITRLRGLFFSNTEKTHKRCLLSRKGTPQITRDYPASACMVSPLQGLCLHQREGHQLPRHSSQEKSLMATLRQGMCPYSTVNILRAHTHPRPSFVPCTISMPCPTVVPSTYHEIKSELLPASPGLLYSHTCSLISYENYESNYSSAT